MGRAAAARAKADDRIAFSGYPDMSLYDDRYIEVVEHEVTREESGGLGSGPSFGSSESCAPAAGAAARTCTFVIIGPQGCARASVGDLDQLDSIVMNFMCINEIPNGSLSVVSSNGRLVVAKSFTNMDAWEAVRGEVDWSGYLDFPHWQFSVPESGFRVGSVTKGMTALSTLLARDRGLLGSLGLDTPVWELLPTSLQRRIPASLSFPGSSETRSLQRVTLQDLLQHAGGWCERRQDCPGLDPGAVGTFHLQAMKADDEVARWLGKALPVSYRDLVTYAFSHPGFKAHNGPGHWSPSHSEAAAAGGSGTFKYSNMGYSLLPLIIEEALGRNGVVSSTGVRVSYEDWMASEVFGPLAMCGTGFGSSHPDERRELEWLYFDDDLDRSDDSFYETARLRPRTYGGGRRLEHAIGSGALVSSAVDLARYLDSLRLTRSSPVLSTTSRQELFRPTGPDRDYGFGWREDDGYRPSSGGSGVFRGERADGMTIYPAWHGGRLEGTTALAYRFNDPAHSRTEVWRNAAFAVVFNRNAPNDGRVAALRERLRDSLAGTPVQDAFGNWSLGTPLIQNWGRSALMDGAFDDLMECLDAC